MPQLFGGNHGRLGRVSWLYRPRTLLVLAWVVLALGGIALLSLTTGGMDLSWRQVFEAAGGVGEPSAVRSIRGRRLPRLLTAIGVGGALGVSGAIFQSVSRNVLGSPDIIGFTVGASTAAAAQILLFGGGVTATALAAVAGGLVTAVIVYALARRGAVTSGLRLVLVGIGVGALLAAARDFLIATADVADASVVQLWSAGSLTGRGWSHAGAVFLANVLLIPPLVLAARSLDLMEMGDDTAVALGVQLEKVRLGTVLGAVLLVGVATAAAGPIAFVALAAPQIARRLTGAPGIPTIASFLMGAALLSAADLLAQTLELGFRTPVGLVTGFLGGLYLVWLLARRS